MLCSKMATRKDGQQFPCGQCLNCRVNRRREWQSRLLLEAASHACSAFVTLTFRDTGVATILRKTDLKYFYRSLRVSHPDIRHFSAGEYGSRFGRAHYHCIIFSDVPLLDDHIRSCWPYGSVDIGNVEPASLDYVLGYLVKNKKQVPWPVEERFPEFRMFSQGMAKRALSHLLVDGCELPREYRVFGKRWPVGRYLRDRAKKMGFSISERESVKLEAYEAQVMRTVLGNPSLTEEEITAAYDDFVKKRNEKAEVIRKKAIRAAYTEQHGHLNRKLRNETF